VKEGLTIEILTQELTGVAQTTKPTDFVYRVNEQTHSANVPSLEHFYDE